MQTRSKRELLNEIEEAIANPLVIESGLPRDVAELLKSMGRSEEDGLVDQRYAGWCAELLMRLRSNRASECFEAIETLREKGINYAYVIRRAFEFVHADLDMDSQLESTKDFRASREQSSKKLAEIEIASRKLADSLNSESDFASSPQTTAPETLRDMKLSLMALIERSLGALEEIYNYEVSNSRAQTLRMVYGVARSIRLNCVLPANEGTKSRWWGELADLMNTAAQIIIEKKLVPTNAKARVYDPEALRVMANDLKDEQIMTLVNALKSKKPDFFAKAANGALPQALEELLEKSEFHPSQSSSAIIELARGPARK